MEQWMNGWMDGWIDWMGRCMGWMDGWIDGEERLGSIGAFTYLEPAGAPPLGPVIGKHCLTL